MTADVRFLREAIKESKKSRDQGNDPFGAVLVNGGKIVARSGDISVKLSDPTHHAELHLISTYCRKNKIFSLEGYTLYTSTEPCIMCSGAIHWSRISKVVFGVSQETLKTTSGGNRKPSCKQLLSYGGQQRIVIGPLLEDEAFQVLDGFVTSKLAKHTKMFSKKRNKT